VVRNQPGWLDADLAVLMEPTANRVEAGCQGTLRALVVVPGKRAHSARSWLGDNAIHRAAEVLARLSSYEPRRVVLDGCEYREGLNAVRIEGGVSGNVVPDRCTVTVNYRFAPDREEQAALEHVQEVLAPFEVVVTDSAAGAMPRLSAPVAQEFVDAVGGDPIAKLGWTDVARFASLGVPAVNFGPGDPNLAHTREEYVEIPRIAECERIMRSYLAG
jgi:succinyl-diaminopimelate desuccinylase